MVASIKLTALSSDYENSHAIVNALFSEKVSEGNPDKHLILC